MVSRRYLLPVPPQLSCARLLTIFCLLVRLVNYTPSATAFRLVSVSALNGYLQSWTLDLSGSTQDPFLLLPTWIIITSVRVPPFKFINLALRLLACRAVD